MTVSHHTINGIAILTGENDFLRFEIAPALGGKITSIYNKLLKKEFLWNNKNLSLKTNDAGADYESNFWGGIDELIPNDIPENIDSMGYPDHGELWTAALKYDITGNRISVHGLLPLSKLYYTRAIYLDTESPAMRLEYKIKNTSGKRRHFMWKLHAALVIEEGDRLITSAQKGRVVNPANSRFKQSEEFNWPVIENSDVSFVSPYNHSMDFFYLYDIQQAKMQLVNSSSSHLFEYSYDKKVFPYQWYFASYGAFLDHYTAILEPASTMPVSVNEAMESGQCSVLDPGGEINTVVHIYAGENNIKDLKWKEKKF